MRRRKFIALLCGAAAAPSSMLRPLAARAQQAGQFRRIGVLMNLTADDPETRVRLAAFLQGLQELGWSEGHNLRIDYRWGMGDADRHRTNAEELVALAPDVILAHGSTIMGPLQRATRTVPIVFVSVADPVAGGFIASLARPGGNATGFTSSDYGMSGKWLELLKQIAPQMSRAAVIRDPGQVSGGGQLGAIAAVAPLFGVEFSPVGVRDAGEIERAITAFARQPNGGLIVTTSASGGLMSYGPDIVDQYRRAASYVDRILKGDKPADLPVQQPTTFEFVINLKTAKALGLDIPPILLALADTVIE